MDISTGYAKAASRPDDSMQKSFNDESTTKSEMLKCNGAREMPGYAEELRPPVEFLVTFYDFFHLLNCDLWVLVSGSVSDSYQFRHANLLISNGSYESTAIKTKISISQKFLLHERAHRTVKI